MTLATPVKASKSQLCAEWGDKMSAPSDGRGRPSRSRLAAAAAALLVLIPAGSPLRAQIAISSISTTFTSGTASQLTVDGGTVTTDNDTLAVNTLTDAQGHTYAVTSSSGAVTLRTDSSDGSPTSVSQWYMGNLSSSGTQAPTTIYAGYNSGSTSSILSGNNLLTGADNLETNSGSTPDKGDVERADVLFKGTSGMTASSTLAFALMDRGTGDSFEVAVITGVDSNGNPTSYGGNLVTITSSEFGGSLLNSSDAPAAVLNSNGSGGSGTADPTDYNFHSDSDSSMAASDITVDTSNNSQNIEGVVLDLADFGISNGTKVYGYSIMAADVTDGGNINNLVNYDNTTYYPGSTTEANGGFDPVDIGAVVFTEEPIPEPSVYGLIFIGLAVAGTAIKTIRRSRPVFVGL
jgi:hypothetical protein